MLRKSDRYATSDLGTRGREAPRECSIENDIYSHLSLPIVRGILGDFHRCTALQANRNSTSDCWTRGIFGSLDMVGLGCLPKQTHGPWCLRRRLQSNIPCPGERTVKMIPIVIGRLFGGEIFDKQLGRKPGESD